MLVFPDILPEDFIKGTIYNINVSQTVWLERLAAGDGPLQLAIFLNAAAYMELNPDDRDLLIKTVQWKEVSVPSQAVAVVLTPQQGFEFRRLLEQVTAPCWLGLGIQARQWGLNLEAPLNRPFRFRGLRLALSETLERLRSDAALKKEFFWKCLKPLLER
ncbi:MAG: hypothetical protein NZL95_07085 [Chitinophagales bacterium]|nr:hypothetical protein [Chitinophagales bacterium]MDW8428300.1 hypothetical protein [Chitinophagales bacterium]